MGEVYKCAFGGKGSNALFWGTINKKSREFEKGDKVTVFKSETDTYKIKGLKDRKVREETIPKNCFTMAPLEADGADPNMRGRKQHGRRRLMSPQQKLITVQNRNRLVRSEAR